ncbi:hypothetical protein BKA63DRAFT_540895 [Paraphoma chrysanthemicola]|nr:hypothetical protein BKA63DRAFT_540895 [Paraphoma chrysanthemicola]
MQYPSEFVAPSQIVAPHPQLPIYADGLLCQLNPSQCQQVLRSTKSMKKHWHINHHGWSAGKKRGRPSRIKAKGLQARMEQGYTRVYCQRLFGSRHGSQYFQVHAPSEGPAGGPEPVPVDSDAAWAQVGKQMAKAWENIEERAQNTIQDGARDERPDLLACIEEPIADADPRKGEEAEPAEAAIWAAFEGLARFSQASVIDRIGVFVWLEAIRTEKHQTRFLTCLTQRAWQEMVTSWHDTEHQDPSLCFGKRSECY